MQIESLGKEVERKEKRKREGKKIERGREKQRKREGGKEGKKKKLSPRGIKME